MAESNGASRLAIGVDAVKEQTRCYRNDTGEDFSLVERLSAKSRTLLAGTPTFYKVLGGVTLVSL